MTAPRIVEVPGFGEELRKALEPLTDAFAKRQQLQLREQELKLQQAEFKQRQDQTEHERAQLEQTGEALRQLMAVSDAQQVPFAQILEKSTGLPAGAVPADQTVQALGPLGRAFQNVPAAAIPSAVQLSPDLRKRIFETEDRQRADALRNKALLSVKDPSQRQAAEALISLRQAGTDLPVETQKAFWPELFPPDGNPEVMSTALKYAAAGGLNWGQVRSLFHLPANTLVPDSFVFPITLKKQQTEKQMTAQLHYTAMARNSGIIDGLLDSKNGQPPVSQGLSAFAQLKRSFDAAQASSSGITGFIANLAAMSANGLLSPDQQQLINAQFAWTNSYRYLVSGQQTSDREFNVILNTVAESAYDSPEVKAQKRGFRHLMTEAAHDLATANLRPSEAAQQVLDHARSQNMNPELIKVLQQQLQDATTFEAKGGNAPSLLSRDRSTSDPNDEATRQRILDMIFQAKP